ncbi:hypothetical protein HPB49_015863 [Dermacentor silvarum]|uniref:Uncharacterized protein n=1 Tax=Dermacentor silvarum TaxID=543639 RepID=A0ACB8CG42_DERSI|nr:hypothetical protein HPB49_015863 [Dermacentor silvarum]
MGCDFSGIDMDYFVPRILALLPSNHSITTSDFTLALPGIEIGLQRLSGFNKILPYGPLVPYCVDGRHMMQVDLINNGDVYFSSRWKSCSGHEGEIRLRNSFSRFTVQFHVLTHPTARAFSLDFEDAVVPSQENVDVRTSLGNLHRCSDERRARRDSRLRDPLHNGYS